MSTLVNGVGYSFANIEIGLLGNSLVVGVREINYASSTDYNNTHGAQGAVVERTRGNDNYEGNIVLTLKEVKRIREANGKRGLNKLPAFPITVTFANGSDPATTDILQFVNIPRDEVSSSVGDEAILVSIPLVIGGILYNQ